MRMNFMSLKNKSEKNTYKSFQRWKAYGFKVKQYNLTTNKIGRFTHSSHLDFVINFNFQVYFKLISITNYMINFTTNVKIIDK